MVAEEAALVLVRPDDNLDTIIKKVQEAGATTVQLLIPDGVSALQQQHGMEQLRSAAGSSGVELLVITSDEKTINAAQLGQVLVMGVRDARVRLDAPPGNGGASPYATRKFAVEPEAKPSLPPAPPSPATIETDEAFLRALDDIVGSSAPGPTGSVPAGARPVPGSADEERFAALDDFSTTVNRVSSRDTTPAYGPTEHLSADDDFAAQLDTLDSPPAPRAERGAVVPPPPRRRVRAEDIELTDEERRRAGTTRGARQPSSYPARGQRTQREPLARTTAQRPSRLSRGAVVERERTRPSWLFGGLILLLILLLVIIGLVLVFGNQATVTVNLPVRATQDQPFSNEPIPFVAPGSDVSSTAIQAETITANVAFTTTGQVAVETMAPATSAAGTVNILSQNTTPVTLPPGTEFIAVNAQGQEVRFASNDAITVSPASTARQGAQIITTLGQAQVNVTARAPGSASNVDANTIRQIVIPGQTPIAVRDGGPIEVNHEPITGGTEQPVRIVKEEDVQQVLGQALAGLKNQARQELESQATGRGNVLLETTTITPRAEDLSQGQGYEVVVSPPPGQPVDNANPVFTVAVQGTFSALVTPRDRPLEQQLQPAISEQLATSGKLQPGDGLSPFITDWRWDGTRLTVEGILRPSNRDDTLDAATQDAIKNSILGKSRAEAEAELQKLVERNVISGFTLPESDSLPGWGFQLDLKVDPAQQ